MCAINTMTAVNSQTQALTNFLVCPDCRHTFDEKTFLPISLDCGHVLCTPCLGRISRLGAKETHCPFDNSPIDEETLGLPINTALLAVLGQPASQATELVSSIIPQTVKDPQTQSHVHIILQILREFALHLHEVLLEDENSPDTLWNEKADRGPRYAGPPAGTHSRPMQKKFIALISCQIITDKGRERLSHCIRAVGERCITELILQHQHPHQLSGNLWGAVRARGCQFLGPAMQEEVLRLILRALDDGSSLARKVLVQYVVQRLCSKYTQASKTSIGHVVQLLYRASCFNLTKLDNKSSLMQLKPEFCDYDALRKEHDKQIIQIANEAGLRIAPDQWSNLLYGDPHHKSIMQSIIDKLQTPQTFNQSIKEFMTALERTDDPHHLSRLEPQLKLAASLTDSPNLSMSNALTALQAVKTCVDALISFIQLPGNVRGDYGQVAHPKYKTCMCRDWKTRGDCPRGPNCTFAHSEEELMVFQKKSNTSLAIKRTTSRSEKSPEIHAKAVDVIRQVQPVQKYHANDSQPDLYRQADPSLYEQKYPAPPPPTYPAEYRTIAPPQHPIAPPQHPVAPTYPPHPGATYPPSYESAYPPYPGSAYPPGYEAAYQPPYRHPPPFVHQPMRYYGPIAPHYLPPPPPSPHHPAEYMGGVIVPHPVPPCHCYSYHPMYTDPHCHQHQPQHQHQHGYSLPAADLPQHRVPGSTISPYASVESTEVSPDTQTTVVSQQSALTALRSRRDEILNLIHENQAPSAEASVQPATTEVSVERMEDLAKSLAASFGVSHAAQKQVQNKVSPSLQSSITSGTNRSTSFSPSSKLNEWISDTDNDGWESETVKSVPLSSSRYSRGDNFSSLPLPASLRSTTLHNSLASKSSAMAVWPRSGDGDSEAINSTQCWTSNYSQSWANSENTGTGVTVSNGNPIVSSLAHSLQTILYSDYDETPTLDEEDYPINTDYTQWVSRSSSQAACSKKVVGSMPATSIRQKTFQTNAKSHGEMTIPVTAVTPIRRPFASPAPAHSLYKAVATSNNPEGFMLTQTIQEGTSSITESRHLHQELKIISNKITNMEAQVVQQELSDVSQNIRRLELQQARGGDVSNGSWSYSS